MKKVVLKRVLFEGRVSECLGYVTIKDSGSIYYLLQGDNERCPFLPYFDNILHHIKDDCHIHILVDEINMDSKFSWAKLDEVKFLNDNHLMETE